MKPTYTHWAEGMVITCGLWHKYVIVVCKTDTISAALLWYLFFAKTEGNLFKCSLLDSLHGDFHIWSQLFAWNITCAPILSISWTGIHKRLFWFNWVHFVKSCKRFSISVLSPNIGDVACGMTLHLVACRELVPSIYCWRSIILFTSLCWNNNHLLR